MSLAESMIFPKECDLVGVGTITEVVQPLDPQGYGTTVFLLDRRKVLSTITRCRWHTAIVIVQTVEVVGTFGVGSRSDGEPVDRE